MMNLFSIYVDWNKMIWDFLLKTVIVFKLVLFKNLLVVNQDLVLVVPSSKWVI